MWMRRFATYLDEEHAFDFVIPVAEIVSFCEDEESQIIETVLEGTAQRLRPSDEVVVVCDRDVWVTDPTANLSENGISAYVLVRQDDEDEPDKTEVDDEPGETPAADLGIEYEEDDP